MAEQAEDPTAEKRADDPDDEITKHTPGALSRDDEFCQKTRDQSDDEPNKNEHAFDPSWFRNVTIASPTRRRLSKRFPNGSSNCPRFADFETRAVLDDVRNGRRPASRSS